MCGIAGAFALNSNSFCGASMVERMSASMSHRGPDDEGFLLAYLQNRPTENYIGDGSSSTLSDNPSLRVAGHIRQAYEKKANVFLAHRRLAILDLSWHGHQPMQTSDGRYSIVYNGEVYNYQEIAKELNKLGVELSSETDTEVVLYAFAQWGEKALDKFNGMFAFAIWDNHKKNLFCARDRIGIKPFYYTVQDGVFIFASEIKTIIDSGFYKPAVDLQGLYVSMSYGIAPRPMTCFKGIYALKQSHWLRLDAHGFWQEQQYWHIPIGEQDNTMSEAEAVEGVEHLLRKAVDHRLIADVPVGTFMSGGVDSTALSAMAAKEHSNIKAFTLAFEGYAKKEFDELSQAKATAEMYPGMQHIVEVMKPENIINHIDKMVLCYVEPFYSLSSNYMIARLAKNHGVTAVLNGLGGDELFSGYQYYHFANRYALCRTASLFAPFLKHIDKRFNKIAHLWSAKNIVQYYLMCSSRSNDSQKQELFVDKQVRQFDTLDIVSTLYQPAGGGFTDNIEAFNYMDLMHYIGNHHVHRVDQFTMHFSLEGRFPLLDHKLVEFAFKIPTKLKYQRKQQKYVLKKVAEKYIHPSCLSMQKKGFGLPVEYWMRYDLTNYIKDNLSQLTKRGIFDPKEIRRRQLLFDQKKLPYDQLWILVMIERWFQLFID